MTKSKTNANAESTASQRKRNANQRSNTASQINSTAATTSASPNIQTTPQQNRKNKQNQNFGQTQSPAQNQTQSQVQSRNQSQASTKPSSPAPPAKTASPPPPSLRAEKHVPLTGFNAAEVDELLTAGVDPRALVYKPEQPAVPKTGPWGQRPGVMATGKDFWLELRRQVAVLQKGESTNKGG